MHASSTTDYARDLIAAAAAAELLDAYQTTEVMAAWADGACTAVELEIAGGSPAAPSGSG